MVNPIKSGLISMVVGIITKMLKPYISNFTVEIDDRGQEGFIVNITVKEPLQNLITKSAKSLSGIFKK